MIVVADSSPIIVLVNIGQIGVLPELFGEVVMPHDLLDARLRLHLTRRRG